MKTMNFREALELEQRAAAIEKEQKEREERARQDREALEREAEELRRRENPSSRYGGGSRSQCMHLISVSHSTFILVS